MHLFSILVHVLKKFCWDFFDFFHKMKSFLSWKKKNFLWKVCRIFWSLLMQTDKKDNSFWHKKIQVFIFNLHFISSVNEVIFFKKVSGKIFLTSDFVRTCAHKIYACNYHFFCKKVRRIFFALEKYAALTSTAFSLRWAVQLCAENVRVHSFVTIPFCTNSIKWIGFWLKISLKKSVVKI